LGVVLNGVEAEHTGYGHSGYRYGYSTYQRDGRQIDGPQGSEHAGLHA
jgi:hypothetical protein